jgi:streptomycin 6-kinase
VIAVPEGMRWWAAEPGGAEWLARLPRLAAECAEQWELRLGAPFEPGLISLVLPAERADGTRAVLKLNFPDPESEHEAAALAHWNGVGAVRLLEHDAASHALLVERCEPGTELWAVADEDEANRMAASILRRLWRPPDDAGYRTLAGEAQRWAAELPTRRLERRLVDEAVAWISELVPTQPELVVAHQDFHGANVLRATREPWLAIDPKPMLAERAFDTASLLRDRRPELARDPHPERRLRRRLDLLSAELGLDRERMRGWAVVHALAWADDEQMIACARAFASLSPRSGTSARRT